MISIYITTGQNHIWNEKVVYIISVGSLNDEFLLNFICFCEVCRGLCGQMNIKNCCTSIYSFGLCSGEHDIVFVKGLGKEFRFSGNVTLISTPILLSGRASSLLQPYRGSTTAYLLFVNYSKLNTNIFFSIIS